jgi:hypothetical protein
MAVSEIEQNVADTIPMDEEVREIRMRLAGDFAPVKEQLKAEGGINSLSFELVLVIFEGIDKNYKLEVKNL